MCTPPKCLECFFGPPRTHRGTGILWLPLRAGPGYTRWGRHVKGSLPAGARLRYIQDVPRRTSPLIGVGTSALLASLTLGVFALNQYGGPESVTTLFIHAVAAGDGNTVRNLFVGDEEIAGAMAEQVSAAVRSGAAFLITDVVRRDDTAVVSILWRWDRARRTMMLPLVKTEGGWKIDARPRT